MTRSATVIATFEGKGMKMRIEELGRCVTTIVNRGPRRFEIEAPPSDASALTIPVVKKIVPRVESLI